jgi:hypothetical protein
VASHDEFGPKSTEHVAARTRIFSSPDRGLTWLPIATLEGQFWSGLFVHRDLLYILGTDRHHGNIILRRSTDSGRSWTRPLDSKSGLLRAEGQYHTAPVPVLVCRGRIWRAFERRDPPRGWGITYRAGMLSAPVDADLLDAASWTASNFLPGEASWLAGGFSGWLEGNAVEDAEGRIWNILRVDVPRAPEKAALVRIGEDGRTASFDAASGFVDFPGGAKKFTIRRDGKNGLYWSLATVVDPPWPEGRPASRRNTLAILTSPDLRTWTRRSTLIAHPDVAVHGYQYVDWLFDGDDIVAVCRTAHDDAEGGAHNHHDANYLTFHRVPDFRKEAAAASAGPR